MAGLLVVVLVRAAATDAWNEWMFQIMLLSVPLVVSAVWQRSIHTRITSARARGLEPS